MLEGPTITDGYDKVTPATLSIAQLLKVNSISIGGKNIPLKLSLYVIVFLRRHQFLLTVYKIDVTWSYTKEGVDRQAISSGLKYLL